MKKIIAILLACTVLLLVGYAGYRGYKVWKQGHMLKLAHGFLAKGDGRNALLSLQQALQTNPQNLEALRLMADITDATRSPAALLFRSRIVEINTRSLEDRLALARTAMVFRDYAMATNALEGVTESGKKTAAYHNVAGAVAAAANHVDEAELHFNEAVRLDPQNAAPQLNLAVVRLHGSNDLDLAEARITLTRLSSNSTNASFRCQALRELVLDALRYKQSDSAMKFSRQLIQETNSAFSDRLLRLQALNGTTNADFLPTLAAYQREAGTNSAKIFELVMWQVTPVGPANTLSWLRTLPKSIQTNQPVTFLESELQVMLRDWPGLQASLTNQNWAELEFLRHAYITRALRGQDLAEAAKAEWNLALKTSNDHLGALERLLGLTAKWNWQSEGEELLWAIVNHYPREKWAVQALSQLLFLSGRTRSLMALYSQQFKAEPGNLSIKNNLAMTALLLEANEVKPYDLAREAYERAPTNSSYASTYAFALLLQKKHAEALKIMQQIKPEELKRPSLAGYYALVLKAAGHGSEAKPYLDLAFKARLLPEEQKLFDRARAGA